MNNTARRAGGVIGIAAYGAIAGTAARPGHFVTGMHTAGLFLAAASAAVTFVQG